MKHIFLTLTVVGLIACGHDECCEHSIVIQGEQFNFADDTQDQVDAHPTDSTDMFGPYPPGEKDDPIDTLQNVGELLDYLETIPSISY